MEAGWMLPAQVCDWSQMFPEASQRRPATKAAKSPDQVLARLLWPPLSSAHVLSILLISFGKGRAVKQSAFISAAEVSLSVTAFIYKDHYSS